MGREILDLAASYVKPGITTDEIDAVVHEATISRGAYPSPLNYRQFPKSVCTSINETICHGIPDKRKLKEGDIINLGKVSCLSCIVKTENLSQMSRFTTMDSIATSMQHTLSERFQMTMLSS